ncbi:protein of unknown function [Paraburkholderia kururiensis]
MHAAFGQFDLTCRERRAGQAFPLDITNMKGSFKLIELCAAHSCAICVNVASWRSRYA